MQLRILAPVQSRVALVQEMRLSLSEADQMARSAVVVAMEKKPPQRAVSIHPPRPLLAPSSVQILALALSAPSQVSEAARAQAV
jgi:hypothetical protein